MKILILNWRDIKHPLSGGAETSTHEHAKGWVKAGHEVTLFSSSFTGAKSFEEIDGVKIMRQGNHYTVHFRAFFYYLKNLRGRIDLIVDEFHFIPFFTPLYIHEKKIAFIHETAQEVWFKNKPFLIAALGYLLEPFFFRLYKNIPFMTVSNSTKEDLINFGIKEKNINVIHNGVNVKHNNAFKEKKPVVIFLGRLSKDKGADIALLAFREIKRALPKVSFWVVGKEEKKGYQFKLKELVNKLKIEKKVKFFDYVPEEKKFKLLKRAWVLIHPSIKEGWGITVIEAASQATPTVAYNVSGLRDSIQNGKTGLLVERKRPADLAANILTLCQKPSLLKKMGQKAKKWSQNFNWQKSTRQSLDLIGG